MKRTDLHSQEYLTYYKPYIELVDAHKTLLEALESGIKTTVTFFDGLDSDVMNYRYAEGKWTPKEVLRHIIDTERIFAYRALRIARKDKTPLAGFEQDDYIDSDYLSQQSMDILLTEYEAVRKATICLFESLNMDMLKNIGVASNSSLSARAAGFIIAGHEISHVNIIKERYM